MDPFLSVIIPAYNEARRISPTLERAATFLSNRGWPWEIVVVSDGSHDETVSIVRAFQERYPAVSVLANDNNRGKGAAVRQGMLAAQGRLRLFMDADSSTPIEEIDKLMPHIWGGNDAVASDQLYHVVIGSLGLPGAEIDKRQFFLRVAAGKIGNIIIQLLVLPGIEDTQRGFKLFTAEAAEKIFPLLSIERWGFDIEALALARKFGFSVKEVPVSWSHNPMSKISVRAYAQVLGEVLRIKWRLWKELT